MTKSFLQAPKAGKPLSLAVAALLALSSLGSCVSIDNTIGSSYVPLDQIIYIKDTTFNVPVGLRYPDSLNMELFDYLPVGSISSQEYGNITLGTAVSIVPTGQFSGWGGEPEFKSMVLALATSSLQTLSDDQRFIPQNIYVHRLTRELDSSLVYGKPLDPSYYSPKQCCEGTNVTMGADTVYIRFPKEFAQPLFSMDSTVLDSVQLFCKQFMGLYIRTDRRDRNDIGGRISEFDISSPCLTLTYTSTRSDGYRRDTVESFMLGGTLAYGFITVERDSLMVPCAEARDEIRSEGIGGITPYINGRQLRDALEEWMKKLGISGRNIMVSKAQFELPVDFSGVYSDYYYYPSNMFPCRRHRDSTGAVIYAPISEIYTAEYDIGTLVKNIDDGRNCYFYRPDAALYIQSLLKEDYEKVDDTYDIWLMPTASYSVSTASDRPYINDYYNQMYYSYYGIDLNSNTQTFYCVDNLTYYQGTLNGTAAPAHPTLKITYTITVE